MTTENDNHPRSNAASAVWEAGLGDGPSVSLVFAQKLEDELKASLRNADANRLLAYEYREALALAHAVLATLTPGYVIAKAKRAAIKHNGGDPMGYITGVLFHSK